MLAAFPLSKFILAAAFSESTIYHMRLFVVTKRRPSCCFGRTLCIFA